MRFFLKCYHTEKLTEPIVINLDRVRWIGPSSRPGTSAVTLNRDGENSRVSMVFFEGQPEDFVQHVISVHGV
jgi:hypothetical protein